jgi:hypothetical protein
LVRVRAAESQEYLKLRQDTAHLLSTELTEEELPTELNRVDVVTTGPLPFYERGELVGLPVLQTIPDNLDKKALVASLASTYQKSIARVGKEAAVDPAADYRHIQVRARHLKRRNEVTAKALYEVHRKTMEHLSVSRNARNSIQGLLYISLENRMRPKLPKWVPELYEFIRHHARKFGHIFPPVDMMPTY